MPNESEVRREEMGYWHLLTIFDDTQFCTEEVEQL